MATGPTWMCLELVVVTNVAYTPRIATSISPFAFREAISSPIRPFGGTGTILLFSFLVVRDT